MRPLIRGLIVGVVVGILASALPSGSFAQEMRIYTRVFNLTPGSNGGSNEKSTEKPPVILRSLTLIHAGKVYDYLETLNEFTIYEPAHRKFTVVSENRGIAAELTQDEIRRYIQLIEEEAGKVVREMDKTGNSPMARAAQALQFQLTPNFKTDCDLASLRMRFNSPFFRYEVECQEAPTPAVSDQYLKFADWTAQLNSVLHPQTFLPGPRLAMNAELRDRKWLPVKVELRVEGETPLHLRAEHELKWELTPRDRQLIQHWEQVLKGHTVKLLPFKQYQVAQLSSTRTSKR